MCFILSHFDRIQGFTAIWLVGFRWVTNKKKTTTGGARLLLVIRVCLWRKIKVRSPDQSRRSFTDFTVVFAPSLVRADINDKANIIWLLLPTNTKKRGSQTDDSKLFFWPGKDGQEWWFFFLFVVFYTKDTLFLCFF